ncbi:DUF1573 domain-containing protein [Stieleria neptunia]|uniref:DUF1573 domain-containing protein n=1 Tax=Stieleria neptunia TaxID=2527979 RepID=UPI0018D20696|nr:DUF1573 domain-containing protein [Stieleria neptunia]
MAFAATFSHLVFIGVVALGVENQASQVQAIDFVPPPNTKKLSAIDIDLAKTDSRKISVGKVEESKLAVFALPIKNASDQEIVIDGIETSCGCLSPVITDLKIPSAESATLYLRFVPDDDGKFVKTVTLRLQSSKRLVLRVVGSVNPRFSLEPNGSIAILPKKGMPISVTANFGSKLFTANFAHPSLSLTRVNDSKVPNTFLVEFSKDAKAPIPFEISATLEVTADGKTFSYPYKVYNLEGIRIRPERLVPNVRGDSLQGTVIITSIQQKDGLFTCDTIDKGVDVELVRRMDMSDLICAYTYKITGDLKNRDKVLIRWKNAKGKQMAISTVYVDPYARSNVLTK